MDANQTEDLRRTPTGPTRELMGRRLRRLAVAAATSAALIGGAVATASDAAALPNTQQCISYYHALAAEDWNRASEWLAEATRDDALGDYNGALAALNGYHFEVMGYNNSIRDESSC
jgi:hypothetical protein